MHKLKINLLFTLALSPLVTCFTLTPAISSEIPRNAIAQSSAGSTSFDCISLDSGYATIAIAASGKKTNPLITYNNPAFSASGYSPQVRCEQISKRLEEAVAENGGKLKNLLLVADDFKGYDVICYVNDDQSHCNKNNLLITLPPGTNSTEFLATFLNVSANPYTSGNPARNSKRKTYIRFGEAVQRELDSSSESNENNRSNNPISNPIENPIKNSNDDI